MHTLSLNDWLAAHPDNEAVPERDLYVVARYMIPVDATLAQGCLEASGIPAMLADAHLMQTDLLLALARGDFALDEDAPDGEWRTPA